MASIQLCLFLLLASDRPSSLKTVSNLQLSPGGATALFVEGATNLPANKTQSRLMRMRISPHPGPPEPVKYAPEGVGDLHWSRDGSRFAYIADGAIWTQTPGGKPRRVCAYDRSNSFLSKAGTMLAWSPDGAQLAFAGTTEPKPSTSDPLVINRILYKTRTAFSDNRRAHIYVVPARGGAPRLLTPGDHDEHSIDWTPDGAEIVFLSNHEPDPDARLNYDLFAVSVAGGVVRRITQTPGVEENPKVSPDGRFIAYVATKGNITTIDSVAEDTHLWIVPTAGGPGRELNAALDRRATSPAWSPDSKSVHYLAGDHGKTLLAATPVNGGEIKILVDRQAQITAFSAAPKAGNLLFVLSDPATPAEIYSPDARLTRLNNVAGWNLSKPETIRYSSFDGTEIEGWLYPALQAQGRTPMILLIHGGPHGQHGYAFNPAIQFWAENGYATLILNPRGSSGYGQRFAGGTLNDWGGGDYKDLMAGVDHVLKTHPAIDPDRLGVTGSSYGGFMTNWVITQTNRFKAAVPVASLSNLISFYATSLYQDLMHAEFNGFPWAGRNFETLWKWSPLAHIASVTTPTLLLHGENDNDVHITQAEEMYTALRQRGIAAELVRYPREGHGFHEPQHIADARRRALEWMDRYLKR